MQKSTFMYKNLDKNVGPTPVYKKSKQHKS